MKEKLLFLFFCMIIVGKVAFAQKKSYFKENTPVLIIPTIAKKIPSLSPNYSLLVLPSNYYYTQLGIICKSEIKIESYIKLPLKIRLGSLQYCNWMEGKKNTGLFH
jgi:hypothetical protein